ncbi:MULTISPECIES: carbonic anhydrase [unclassified Symbiopectobacterium]|uniref:carbonic anhydrase n=2 Tax=Symbiopectobacterium TaxID=801 RepID=UPI002227357C|nr:MULTISPECIES: carbonic anhydrase [unclassified Symbiopectobacterium]MCW2473074.1 carbonic anhydrase [Candidatus Symbiopectobacterium sp. NZEC151]MCW2488667.1 carbonic anhydrase [Candidatus Symbiopectobacterium sp. NZEC127]
MSKFDAPEPSRRAVIKRTAALSVLALTGISGFMVPHVSYAASLTQAQRDSMTPDDVIKSFKAGNARFREGKMQQHDFVAQKISSQEGQFPAAVILSCIDSRAPAEILLDTGIGETFNARVAGNVQNEDILGSMEFACAAAGAKVVLVMGHTACGAVAGAIDNVELGNLTGLLNKIKPAVEKTVYEGDRTGKNMAFVDAVAKTNVALTVEHIREHSPILKKLEQEGKIKIVGSMYHLVGGEVEFLS